MELIRLDVNDYVHEIHIEPGESLLDVLRERLDLTGAKRGCNTRSCGACKVIVDNEAVNSCSVLAKNMQGKKIYTVESLAGPDGLHPIQESFIEAGAVQCGYCTPGMVMSTKALLDKEESPTDSQIKEALSGNLCRCTGYVKIEKAVKIAAEKLRGSENE